MGVQVGDKVQVNFVGRCYSQRIMLTTMWRVAQAAAPGETYALNMTQLIDSLDVGGANSIVTPYLALLQEDYTLIRITAQAIHPVRLAYVAKEVARPGNGGAGSVANDSACLTLRTANAGRSQVANKHIGPVPDGVSLAGRLDVAYKALVATLGSAMTATIQPDPLGAIYQPVIFHRASELHDGVTGFIVGDQSRVQRRRTVGVGE